MFTATACNNTLCTKTFNHPKYKIGAGVPTDSQAKRSGGWPMPIMLALFGVVSILGILVAIGLQHGPRQLFIMHPPGARSEAEEEYRQVAEDFQKFVDEVIKYLG